MEVKAKANQIRMAPQKVRLVASLVRGLETGKALGQLKFCKKHASGPIAKLVNSAIANAEHNFDLDRNNLFIKEIKVDEGVPLHRWTPKAHGRATPIRKRASHVTITLAEITDSGKKEAKKQAIEAPIKLGTITDEVVKEGNEERASKSKELKDDGKVDKIDAKKGYAIADGGTEGKGFINKVFRRKSG